MFDRVFPTFTMTTTLLIIYIDKFYRLQLCTQYIIYRFIGQLLRLLLCSNERFGQQIQTHVKELVGNEMSPALYPILFDQIKAIIDKFFDQQQQVGNIFKCR